ncbi:MAG: polysaccharide biosynthesis protein [Planctomycetota bacterium]
MRNASRGPEETERSEQHGPVPSTVIIVGDPDTVLGLRSAMVTVDGAPEPIGCVLVKTSHRLGVGDPIAGLPVLGFDAELADLHDQLEFDEALVTLPAARSDDTGRIQRMLGDLGVRVRIVRPLGEQILGDEEPSAGTAVRLPGSVGGAHTVPAWGSRLDLATLIGREPYGIDRRAVADALRGKRVLITGAGGSIGSELARIAATFDPEQLILVERSENALFEIDRQLAWREPQVRRRAVLHDVVDAGATERLFQKLRPEVVFHAAAHKHVPLMEDHPAHAVRNNYFGTRSVARAAASVDCGRFVLISSDKAVNPKSVMGATKRLAELELHAMAPLHAKTRLSMVRFGNVLGSAGSVLAIWDQQLADGGPLTVTDERMTRFFMTIPEAASLVIQASVLPQGSGRAAVYELDMGEPIRILDLAKRFIRLHGYEPRLIDGDDTDALDGWLGRPMASQGAKGVIDVVLTGIRPGEKLHEELSYDTEQVRPTTAAGVKAWAHKDLEIPGRLGPILEAACSDAEAGGPVESLLDTIHATVPEMAPSEPSEGPKNLGTAAA